MINLNPVVYNIEFPYHTGELCGLHLARQVVVSATCHLLKEMKTSGDKKMNEEQAREQRIRRLLKKEELLLRKSRVRNWEVAAHRGGYQVINFNNVIVAGEGYAFSLDDVERWLG